MNNFGRGRILENHEKLYPVIFGATHAQDFRLLFSPNIRFDEERLLMLCRAAIEGLREDNGFRTLQDITWVAATSGANTIFGMGASGEYLSGKPVKDKDDRDLSYFVGWLINQWTSGICLPMEPSWYSYLYRYIESIQDEYIAGPKRIDEEISLVWNDHGLSLIVGSKEVPVANASRVFDSIVPESSSNLLRADQGPSLWRSIRKLHETKLQSDVAFCINVQSEATAERLLRNGYFDVVSCRMVNQSRYIPISSTEEPQILNKSYEVYKPAPPTKTPDADGHERP